MIDVKKILIGILAVIALLQFAQFAGRIVTLEPLGGVVAEDPWPGFSLRSVETQKFQDYVSNYAGYHFGFRPLFVRLNNQFYYSLFRKSPYPSLIIGKKGYLFEMPYIESYFGKNFVGCEAIDNSLVKLDSINRFLDRRGVKLVIVIAPDKANYYNEYIPDYLVSDKKVSNYDLIAEGIREKGIPLLDANAWFLSMKKEARYPLVPKSGVHWSEYGATLVADSLIGFIGNVLGKRMVRFTVDSINYPCYPRKTDIDLYNLANIFTASRESVYAYPVRFSHKEDGDRFRPHMLVISDSFFWTIYQGNFTHCFTEVEFWYYFNSIFPELPDKIATTEEIDIVKRVLGHDVLLLLTSTDNLKHFGFGFIEYMDEYLGMSREEKYSHLVPRYERSIRNNPGLLATIGKKATDKGISVDSMIYLDACWLANKHMEDLCPQEENH